MKARQNRDYDHAVALYELLITLVNQETCEVLIEYAVTLELMGKYSEALAISPRIEQRIRDSEDLGNYGWLLANLGRYDDGIKYFKQAINKAPGLNNGRPPWP